MKKLINQIVTVIVLVVFMLGSFSVKAQSNPKNPYDYAGKQHNKVISKSLKKYSITKFSDKQLAFVNNLIDSYNIKGKRLTINEINFIMDDYKNDFKNVINKSDLSSTGKKIIQDLISNVIKMSYDEKITYTIFYNSVVSLENKILSNKKLSPNDMKSLLELTSIARYSGFLWNDFYNIKNTSSKKSFQENIYIKKWWKWLIIVAADVAGGVYGNVAGAASASTAANTILK